MRQSFKAAVLAIGAVLTIGAPAQAQLPFLPAAGGAFYLGGEAGWTRLETEHATATIPTIGLRRDRQTWRGGFDLGVRAGYEWGPWRLEEEFRYQRNDDRKLENSGGRGEYAAAALMSNLLYDFALAWPLSPHVGVGIGAVHLDSRLDVTGLGRVITGGDWVFGYQAIAGLRYPIGGGWALDVDYRYLATAAPRFTTGANFVDGGVHAPGVAVGSGYHSHSLVASLSLLLGSP